MRARVGSVAVIAALAGAIMTGCGALDPDVGPLRKTTGAAACVPAAASTGAYDEYGSPDAGADARAGADAGAGCGDDW